MTDKFTAKKTSFSILNRSLKNEIPEVLEEDKLKLRAVIRVKQKNEYTIHTIHVTVQIR